MNQSSKQSDQQAAGENGDSLLSRLRGRRLFQEAAIYIAVAWGALEILITVQENLGWPEAIGVWATRLFVAGFPLVIILAWRRNLETRLARAGLVGLALLSATVALWLTLATGPGTQRERALTSPVTPALATLAVLPFANGMGDAAFDYLANGFTAELIGRLSKHPDLAVVQEQSAQAPLLASLLPVAKARTLGASFLVQGRVLRENDFIEVSASLQDLQGQVLWSEILREPYAAPNIIAMQRRISGEVSRVLGTRLNAPAYCGETADIGAMELYYRGRQRVGTRQTDAMESGLDLLQQAVAADPYFGRAWSALGGAQLALSGRLLNPESGDPQRAGVMRNMAMSSLRRALDICPTIGGAYKIIVPPTAGIDNEAIDQEIQWRDALAMDPNDAALLRQYAFHLMQHGRNQAAIEVMERAYANEPLLPMIPAQLALALAKSGRCEDAMELALEAEQLGGQPSVSIAGECRAYGTDQAGIARLASEFAEIGLEFPLPALGLSLDQFAAAYADPDSASRPALIAAMAELWRENPDQRSNPYLYWLLDSAANLGELDLVFEMLDAIAGPQGFYPYNLAFSPLFQSGEVGSRLRTDPRFVELLARTNYREYWEAYGWPSGCEAAADGLRCF